MSIQSLTMHVKKQRPVQNYLKPGIGPYWGLYWGLYWGPFWGIGYKTHLTHCFSFQLFLYGSAHQGSECQNCTFKISLHYTTIYICLYLPAMTQILPAPGRRAMLNVDFLFCILLSGHGYLREGELISQLLEDYNQFARPVVDPGNPVRVNITIQYHQLLDLVRQTRPSPAK